MNMIYIVQIFIVVYCGVAATIDYRTGLIPNWLTFPAILVAPLLHLLGYGFQGFGYSIAGIIVCGLIPYVMFCYDAIGGGDVKLFAAIGAIGAPLLMLLTLEAQLYSFIVASVIALIQIAWKGSIKQSFQTMGTIISNLFKKSENRTPVDTSMTHSLRLGPSIFLGTLICFLGASL